MNPDCFHWPKFADSEEHSADLKYMFQNSSKKEKVNRFQHDKCNLSYGRSNNPAMLTRSQNFL